MTINDNYPAAVFITLPIYTNATEWKTLQEVSLCLSTSHPTLSLPLSLSLAVALAVSLSFSRPVSPSVSHVLCSV